MAENKWILDGHHYTCPECGNMMAIVVNESDDGFEFCPYCGKRLAGQVAQNKMELLASMFGKKLGEEFEIRYKDENYTAYFRNEGLRVRGLFCLTWDNALVALLTGRAVIVDD